MNTKTVEPSIVVNLNKKIIKAQDAKISIFDRGFLFGDSIYEVSYAFEGKVLFLDDHLQRLYNSATLLKINIDFTIDEIKEEINKTLQSISEPLIYIRIIITRGESKISLAPQADLKNNFIIIAKPLELPPKKFYEDGIKLMTSTYIRNSIQSVDPNAKSGNYLNNIMAIQEAKNYDYDDAIMLNHDNLVTEGTTFNIFCIKDDQIITPSLESGLLKGITRQKIIELCHREKFDLKLSALTLEELKGADEVFITSSTRGVMPVSKIDKQNFPKSIAKNSKTYSIRKLYLDLIKNS